MKFKKQFKKDIELSLNGLGEKEKKEFLKRKIKELKNKKIDKNFKELLNLHLNILKEELKSLTES